MNKKTVFAILIVVSLLTACAQATTPATNPPPVSTNPAPTSIGAYPPPGSINPTPTKSGAYPGPTSEPTQPAATPTHIPVDIPPIQMKAIETVSSLYNIPAEQIHVVSSEEVTWPNGCLGVYKPDVMCTDALVPGFRIILEANGQQYEIHTNLDGTIAVDATQSLSTLQFVVLNTDRSLQVINSNIAISPTYNPAFNGFLPTGRSIFGTAYVLDYPKVVAIDPVGQRELSFIQNPTSGLAIWPGGQGNAPLLAWGTQPVNSDRTSSLMISNLDGSNLQTLLTINSETTGPVALVAELWSSDGQSLYFSKEPVGIGGYIPFSGASNLYKIDVTTRQVSEIIPQANASGIHICLDAISGDYRFVADHCTQDVITIRDLQSGNSTTIQAPNDVTGFRFMGSARFSPTGDRVAFAMAQGNADNEQSWVAVGATTGGVSKLVLTGEAGGYYNVIGWLDDQTLLVQYYSVTNPSGTNQVFTVGADGSNATKVTDGMLLSVIDNR